jgi:hypothetical protein
MEIKSNQIAGIISKNDFKHINLMGTEKTFQHFNRLPKDLKKKIISIQKDIKQNPDEKFSISCKRVPNGDLWVYQIENKNYLSESPVQTQNPMFYQNSQQLEKFQTLDAYKMQMEKIAGLEKEIELMKMETMYKSQLNEKPADDPIKSFSTNIIPMFMPLLEKYMENQTLKNQIKLNESGQKTTIQKQPAKTGFRPIPDINSDRWESYLDYLENLNTQDFETEIKYLSNYKPDHYKIIYDTFLNEEEETEQTEQTENETN